MHKDVFIGTGTEISLGNQIRPGRVYALGVYNCDVAFDIEFSVPGVGFKPTDWDGGQTPDATKIITTEFTALVTGIRLKLASAPAGTVTVILQERKVEVH